MPPFGGAPLDPRLHDVRPRASLVRAEDDGRVHRSPRAVARHLSRRGRGRHRTPRDGQSSASRGRHLRARARVRGPRARCGAAARGARASKKKGAGRGGEGRRQPLVPPNRDASARTRCSLRFSTRHLAEAFEAARLVPRPRRRTRTVPWRGREGPPSPSARADGASKRVGTTDDGTGRPRSAGGSRRGRLRCVLSHTGPHTTALAW